MGIIKVLVENRFGVRVNIDGNGARVDAAIRIFNEEFNEVGTHTFEVESLGRFTDDGISNFHVVNFPPVFSGATKTTSRGISSGYDSRETAGMREVVGKDRCDIAGISFCREEDKSGYQTYNYFILHGLAVEHLNIEL